MYDEKSIFCVHVVAYESHGTEKKWQPLGNGEWAEMHIFKVWLFFCCYFTFTQLLYSAKILFGQKETVAGNRAVRAVAWVSDTTEVVLNVALQGTTTFDISAEDFGELVPSPPTLEHETSSQMIYGFYFADATAAAKTSDKIKGLINEIRHVFPHSETSCVATLMSEPGKGRDSLRRTSLAALVDVETEGTEQCGRKGEDIASELGKEVNMLKFSVKTNYKPLGSVSSLPLGSDMPGREGICVDPSKKGPTSVSAATLTEHGLHVSFNEERARFEGLPEEWKHINKQFGLPLDKVPRTVVPGYKERIPSLLVMMKRELEKGGGRNQEGIFRLAPNTEDCSMTKNEMNNGEFEGVDDVNVIANLIKVSISA